MTTSHSKLSVESDFINPGSINPLAEVQKQRLMTALIVKNPELQPFEFGYPEIARTNGITESEARIQFRHIELNGRDNGNGIQIVIYDDNVRVTVPYWHHPPAAVEVFEEVWRYLHVMMLMSKLFVYDPQLDRVPGAIANLRFAGISEAERFCDQVCSDFTGCRYDDLTVRTELLQAYL